MKNWTTYKNKFIDLLCPAGDGVYAVTSKASIKNSLQGKIYGVPPKHVEDKWQENLASPPTGLCILGVSSDCGGGILRGANWGPLYLRQELYSSQTDLYDLGDVRVIPQLLLDDYLNIDTIKQCRKSLYLNENSEYPVSPLSITEKVQELLYEYDNSLKILALGGDHSISYPLVKSYLQYKKLASTDVAIVHFDAHTDLLESRLGLPITFGSWVYHVLPYILNDRFIQIGIRASGHPKSYWEEKYGIKQFWSDEIINNKVNNRHIISYLKEQNVNEIYISFDIDVIDEKFVSATGTAEPNGLYPDIAYQLLEDLISNFKLTGADLVEVAPLIKVSNNDQTMQVAKEIMNILCHGMF